MRPKRKRKSRRKKFSTMQPTAFLQWVKSGDEIRLMQLWREFIMDGETVAYGDPNKNEWRPVPITDADAIQPN